MCIVFALRSKPWSEPELRNNAAFSRIFSPLYAEVFASQRQVEGDWCTPGPLYQVLLTAPPIDP
jgi:hypothetical protein